MVWNKLPVWLKKKQQTGQHSSNELLRYLHRELHIEPVDPNWYALAFRHSTTATRKSDSNERLEFVGDAILDAIVADLVYDAFPDKPEGFLSKIKSAVVNRQILNTLARDMGMEPHIDARIKNRKAMHVIGGNTLEALIGAIYKDRGYQYTHKWVEKHVVKKLNLNKLRNEMKDAKSELFEIAHRKNADLRFETKASDNSPRPGFESTVFWNKEAIATGTGSSKKSADQKAAKNALTNVNADKFGNAAQAD